MATAILCASPPCCGIPRRARSYALLTLLVIGPGWRSSDTRTASPADAGTSCVASLAVYAHIIAVVFVAAQLLWLAAARGRQPGLRGRDALVVVLVEPQMFAALRPGAATSRLDTARQRRRAAASAPIPRLRASGESPAGLVLLIVGRRRVHDDPSRTETDSAKLVPVALARRAARRSCRADRRRQTASRRPLPRRRHSRRCVA